MPKLDEKWLRKKAEDLSDMSAYCCGQVEGHSIAMPQAMGFIRSIVSEVKRGQEDD